MPVVRLTPPGTLVPLRTDEEVARFLSSPALSLVEWGASWCTHCRALAPKLSEVGALNPAARIAVAHVDSMERAADGIVLTPTFRVYRHGKKVDEFAGADASRLEDRLWLQGFKIDR